MDANHFNALPDEMLLFIMRRYLGPKEWVELARTCERFARVVADRSLWNGVAVNLVKAPWYDEVRTWADENLQVHVWAVIFFTKTEEDEFKRLNPTFRLYPN